MSAAREAKALIEQGGASSSDEQDYLDRDYRIVDLVEWTLSNTDPLLIATSTLSEIETQIRAGMGYVNSWKAGQGPEYLTAHADGAFDGALRGLGSIPVSTTTAEAASEVASLRRSVGQHRGQVEREIESLQGVAADERARLAQATAEGTNAIAQLQADVAALRAEADQIMATAREATNSQQNAFTAAQTERQEAFSRLLEEKRTETSAAVDRMRVSLAEELDKAKEQVADDLEIVEGHKERVEEILNLVGEEALVGTYSKNADSEKKSADIWRIVSVVALLLTAGAGIWLVATAKGSGSFQWDEFLSKLVLAIPAGGLAAYAARQSSEHRHAQREVAHMALQLAALKPYLHDLNEPADRDKLLIEIARRLFGQPRSESKADDTIDALADGPTAAALIIKLIQAAAKA